MNGHQSYLFVPGVSAQMFDKALDSEADCVIFDLEDAVAFSEKELARERLKNYLLNKPPGKDSLIRINDLTTTFWKDDLVAAIDANVSGIMVPKAECAWNLKGMCETAAAEFEKKGRNPFRFSVIPLIETARGVHSAFEIASAHPFINRLAFGSIDYCLDIDCELTEDGLELLFARSQMVNASKAAGIEGPIDTVYPQLENEKGLMDEALRARKLGFKGKLAIHPKQITAIHSIFTPTQEEIERASRIVSSFEAAEGRGIASIKVGSQFVDYPVYKKAKEILQLKNK